MNNIEICSEELEKRISVLKRVSIFSETDHDNLVQIALLLTNELVESEMPVFHKGDIGNAMYIITKGIVKVHDGNHIFTTLKTDQFFGEYSLIDSSKRSASVTATEETELLRLDQSVFFQIMASNIDFSRSVLKAILKRLYDKDFLEEELARKNAEIRRQKEEIEVQKEKIVVQNKNITDSIRYALRIQKAILPSDEFIHSLHEEVFVLFKPKSIVSGDFFWFEEKHDKILFSAVDCTGHGVPGAFMSILGNTILRQALGEYNLSKPSEILNFLSKSITKILRQKNEESSVKDGMDLAMCSVDLKNMKMEFAAVHNPGILIRNGVELIELMPDNYPIGEPFADEFEGYRHNEHDLMPGDTIYVFSDGYIDQFGGPNKKKFMIKNFRATLLEIQPLSMQEQKAKLEEIFENWKGETTQIDDVLVIGFRV